ncbi:MAG: secretin N-terminal domain-containing protein [Planctomycetota bacterium]
MFNRLLVFICITALSAMLCLAGFAQDAPATPPAGGSGASGGAGGEKIPTPPQPEVTVALSGVQIGTFLNYIAEREKKLIMCEDTALKQQTFNIIPQSFKVPADKYAAVVNSILDATLRMRGSTLLRTDPIWKVVKITDAAEHPSMVSGQANIENLPGEDRVVTQVIQLKYADAATVSNSLGPLRSKGMSTSYLIIPENNTLIITDYGSNIRRYWEIIKMLDQEDMDFKTETRQLKNIAVIPVKTNLDQYIQVRFSGRPKSTPRIFMDERTNSLIILAQQKDMPDMLKIIDVFDAETPKEENETYIYKLTNTNAEDVHKIVDAVFKQPLSAMGATVKTSEKNVSIQPDKNSNSLIISAPKAMLEKMLELIKEIDVKKPQVLLVVAIAELTDEKMVQLGIELASVKEPTSTPAGFGGTSVGLSKLDPATGGKVPIIPDAPEKGIGSLTVGMWKDTRYNIPFLMQAAQKDSGINLKAAPVLLANDNTEASIEMADKAPNFSVTYPGGVGQPAVTSLSGYVEAKISLKITPVINIEDNYIKLSIEQTSEQFLGEPDQKTPKTSRTAKTMVTVPDKNTVVIGGLTREVTSKSVAKVPLLGDIPLLGYLFRKDTDSIRKYHLCIFIKPNIMKEFSELLKETRAAENALEEKKKEGILKEENTKQPQ